MSAFILLIVGFVIFCFFYGKNEQQYSVTSRLRLAFIQTLLVGGSLIYVSTELLSYFYLLNYSSIFFFWVIIFFVFGYFNFTKKYWRVQYSDIVKVFRHLPCNERYLLLFIGFVYLVPLLMLSVIAPPNNTDSVNYHLARVVFWLQNQNVAHYPTVYIQQLYHNVFSEYILLHVMALDSWNDHYVNLVQWIAMLGSVFVIGLVGKQFGFGRKMQLFLSVMQLTLPIGILESTTTQNDYIANFLFLSFLYFGIVIIKQTRKEIFDYKSVGWMALALALGGFNKYTVLLFGFPICIWIGVELLKNLPLKYSIYTVLTALLLLIVVFTPFFKRNYDLFDNVLSSTKESPLFTEEVATERKCIGCVVSVTLKNLTGHLGLPVQSYNEAIDKAVAVFHQLIGIPLNTPELNVDDYYTRFGIQEDMSHNPWHFILICVGIVWLLFQKKHGNFKLLLLCAVVGFVLFSALIKYQIYNTRVIMPFFSMGFVWTGLMVNLWTNKWRNGLMVLFLLAGLPYLYTNYNKNLLPLRQWSKYVLGYIPPFLCVKEGQIEKYQNQFGAIYDFGKGTPCYPLKSSPNYIQRLSVVSQLQALGYYKNEEMAFWRKSREENYFTEMYDLGLYSDLKTIVAGIDPKAKGVGVLWGNVLGFYREWLLFKNALQRPVPMQYILYQQKCQDTPNASRHFVYDYVLLDHPDLVTKYLDKSQISAITTTKNYILVKLKRPITQQYTYISRAEVEKYETRR